MIENATFPLCYLAAVAFVPVAYATAKAAAGGRWRNLTFARAVAKDFLRTTPAVSLAWAGVFALAPYAKWYVLAMHAVFMPLFILEVAHIRQFGARIGINTFYSLFVTNRKEFADFCRQNVTVGNWIVVALLAAGPVPAILAMPPVEVSPLSLRVALAAAAFAGFAPFVRNLTKKGSRFKIGYILNPYTNLIYHYFQFRRSYGELMRNIAAHSAPPFAGIVSSLPAGTRETYVITIGESASSWHHSYCGYFRRTNEFTDALGEAILRIPGTRSPFAQTLPVLEKVLTFADAGHPDRLWTQGSMIDYFKDAGFKTFWLSNQYALDDTAITALAGHADVRKCFNFGDMKRFERTGLDGDMIPEIAKAFADGAPRKAIFVHMIGSHAAYVNRYPAEFRHFEGSVPGKDLSSVKLQMVNTYDDSIRYTDWVVSELARELEKTGGASYLLYFADHGEDVFDTTSDKILGHSQLANEPMTSVPLMLWMSPEYRRLRPDVAARKAKDSYCTEDIIHTVIDISSLSNPDYNPSKSVFAQEKGDGEP